jgi:hypothetical protein
MTSVIHTVGKAVGGRRLLAITSVALGLSLLAGCGGGGGGIRSQIPSLICPAVGLVGETSTVTKFREKGSYLESDVLYEAYISGLSSSCDEESGGVVADFTFDLTAIKGASSGTDQVSLPYFVAVATPGGGIISKQVFNAVVDLSKDGRGTVREHLQQHIQADGQDFHTYEVLIGFQLTEDDLVYNLSQ